MVRSIRATRERTTAGAVPSASIASTRARDARMSASVGAGGTVTGGGACLRDLPVSQSQKPTRPQSPRLGLATHVVEVELAAGRTLVLRLHAGDVRLGLLDLVLEDADGLRHGVESLELELVDGVHRRVAVGERRLELLDPDR